MKDSLDILCTNYEVKEETCNEIETVYHDSLNILRTDVICHHGILGMKWGIRRYQNKDGSLTAAGKKRYYTDYDWSAKSLTKKGKKALQDKTGAWKDTPAGKVAKAYDEAKDAEDRRKSQERLKQWEELSKRGEQYLKEVDFVDTDWRNGNNPKTKERLSKAADLGLRALQVVDNSKMDDKEFIKTAANDSFEKVVIPSMGYSDGGNMQDKIKSAKNWFNYEDQTIGYTTVADLVNQGLPKEKVKDITKAIPATEDWADMIDEKSGRIAFEMSMYNDHPWNYADKFLDACYLIKEAQKKSK